MSVLSRTSRFAARHDLWRPETRVIAAVSGGSDSVALLVLLHDLHARGDLVLDAVAHLNHAIRGEEADEDEAFCRALAARLKLPFVSQKVDIPARATEQRLSLEIAGRHARREFFAHVRATRGAERVATAHTRDDQAETVLLRLARGTALRGLGGIAPARGAIIRPLLDCSRQELREMLTARNETWREDPTNTDLTIPRNRVRHELLPYLETHFNPSSRRALARLASLARSDEDGLARESMAASLHLLDVDRGEARIDIDGLTTLPDAIARRVVQHALETVTGTTGCTLDDIEAVRAVAVGERVAAEVRGLRVEHSGDFVVLVHKGSTEPTAAFSYDLPIPGYVSAPDAGWALHADGPYPRRSGSHRMAPDEVEIEAEGLGPELVVRSRQPGDRIRPVGLGGQKKLQDLLVDRKVIRQERDQIPVVTDKKGRIVWVAGHALGEEFRVTEDTNAVIILKLRRLPRRSTRLRR